MAGGPNLQTGKESYVKVIPKKDRDTTLPESYCPISLINIDAKSMVKIVSNRISKILPSLLHPAQQGFVKGCSAVTNICKVLAVMEHIKTNPHLDAATILLDAEKAFDNVDLQWFFLVLQCMGFQGNIMNFLQDIYESPTARIFTLINPFPFAKGDSTRMSTVPAFIQPIPQATL